jgi:hypothetical protein
MEYPVSSSPERSKQFCNSLDSFGVVAVLSRRLPFVKSLLYINDNQGQGQDAEMIS